LRPLGVGPHPQTDGRARVAQSGGGAGGALFVVALMLDWGFVWRRLIAAPI